MSKQVILVTGSSSGIGASLVRRLAKPGTHFVLHARQSAQALEEVAQSVHELGAQAVTVLGDLAEPDLAERLVGAAQSNFGQLDVVVANAGFPLFVSFREGTMADLESAFRGNLFSFFALARAAWPLLRQSSAPRIVAVGSYTAHLFTKGTPLYPMSAASKGAIETAVRSLSVEFARDNILVNCVVPGEINSNDRPIGERLKAVEAAVPLGRLGKAHEVAAAIAFLASPDASYITGQVLHVNGGLY